MSEDVERLGIIGFFDVADAIKNHQAYRAAVVDSWQTTKKAADGMQKSTEQAATSVTGMQDAYAGLEQGQKTLAQSMYEQGAAIRDIAQFLNVGRDQIEQWVGVQQQAASATQQTTQAVSAQTNTLKSSSDSVKKHTGYIDQAIKRYFVYRLLIGTVVSAVRNLSRAVSEGIEILLEDTREWDNYQRSLSGAKAATALMIGTQDQLRNAVGKLSQFVDNVVLSFGKFKAVLGGLGVTARALLEGMTPKEAQQAGLEAISQIFKDFVDGWEKGKDAADTGAKDMERSIDSLIGAMMDFDTESDRYIQALKNIERAYLETAQAASFEYYKSLEDIARRQEEELTDINADAADARAKAYQKYNERLAKLQDQVRRNEADGLRRHLQDLEYMRKRYELTQLQSERRYLSERAWLEAEGDTLAIDRLDERYAIEKQEREENYRLQREQAEAMYRLQAQILADSMREQVDELRRALQEQLQEIEERRQERIQEAKEGFDEEREEARQAYAEQMLEAEARRQEELAREEESHKQRLERLAEFLRNWGMDNELGLQQTLAIWQSYYGAGGPIDTLLNSAFQRYTAMAAQLQAAMQAAVSSTAGGVGGYTPRRFPTGGGGGGGGRFPRMMQHGGIADVTGPTPFMAGERRPERVQVTPLNMASGSISVSVGWTGGAIPVHGTGNLAGMDMSEVANGVSVALLSAVNKQMNTFYGTRGR